MGKLLLIWMMLTSQPLMAGEVTYTVSSYHEVTASGDVPEATVSFESTTQSGGRITAGNTATLTLSGWSGMEVWRIVLGMRSNKSAGSGSLLVTADGEEVAAIDDAPFSSAVWHGSYSTENVEVEVPMAPFMMADSLMIRISASANSLYIAYYRISYAQTETGPQPVDYVTGVDESRMSDIEQEAGSGVLLPRLNDVGEWRFIGWTEEQVATTAVCPDYYPAGTRYYPQCFMTLYALYTDGQPTEGLAADTSLTSGVYALVSPVYGVMMRGGVQNRGVQTDTVGLVRQGGNWRLLTDYIPRDSRYELTIDGEGVCIRHQQSGRYLGYSSTGHYLRVGQNPWQTMGGAEHTLLFYHDRQSDGTAWCLHPRSEENGLVAYYDTRLMLEEANLYTLLFRVPEVEPTQARYTGRPLAASLSQTETESRTGIIYSLLGQPMGTSLTALPAGLYVRDGKLIKR